MAARGEILHRGRIVSITPEITSVEIISESACGSCHARGLCSMSESRTKIVEVATSGWDNFAPGDEVLVTLKASMGHKAVWIAYVIPLFVLMGVLLGLTACGLGELDSGIAAIVAVLAYYAAIWLLRGRLRNEYIFNIKQL